MIPPIIIINLEWSKERKQNMLNQFTKLRMVENKDFYFLPAYSGVNFTNFTFNINIAIGYGTGRKFQKAEIGIILSQMAAIKFAQMMKFESVIILEDDVVICEDWEFRLNELNKLLPSDWEHVYLSGHSLQNVFQIHEKPIITPSPLMVGAFSYLVNKSAYSKIINIASTMLTTYDDLIMHAITNKKLNSYVYFPFMTYHNAKDSTVWDGAVPLHLTHENDMHSSYKFFKNNIKS